MVGDRKDSALYVKMKKNACQATGIRSENVFFKDRVSQVSIASTIAILWLGVFQKLTCKVEMLLSTQFWTQSKR